MFELGILGIVLLAICYAAILWIVDRRRDVLHGHFVEAEPPPGPYTENPQAPSDSAKALQRLLVAIERDAEKT